MSHSEEHHELPPRKEAALQRYALGQEGWLQEVGEKVAALLIKEMGENGANVCHAMLDADELHDRMVEYVEGGEGFLTGVSAGLKKDKA